MKKSEVVLSSVKESADKHKMFRSLGRMFIRVEPAELEQQLGDDIKRISAESARATAMKKNFEDKKEALTKALNDLTPK